MDFEFFVPRSISPTKLLHLRLNRVKLLLDPIYPSMCPFFRQFSVKRKQHASKVIIQQDRSVLSLNRIKSAQLMAHTQRPRCRLR